MISPRDAALLGGAVLAVAAGGAAALDPQAGVGVAVAPLLAGLVVVSAPARVVIFIFGGLLVLQSSEGVSASKLGWLGLTFLAASVAAVRLVGRTERTALPVPVFATFVYATSLAFAVVVGVGNGHSVDLVFRDALPYALLPIGALLAVEAATTVSRTAWAGFIGIGGLAATVGFTTDWLDRRGLTALPFGRVLLATGVLAALGFAFATANVALRPGVTRWALMALAIPSMLLTTGSRSVVLYGVGLLGLVRRGRGHGPGAGRAVGVGLLLLVGVIVVAPFLATRLSSEPDFLQERVRSGIAVLSGDRTDQSYAIRESSYLQARRVLERAPWTGAGVGHQFLNDPTARTQASYSTTLDTPMVTPAKFGLIGLVGVLGYLFALYVRLRRVAAGDALSEMFLRAFSLIILATLPLGSFIEDKGFAFAVCLLCGYLASASRLGHDDDDWIAAVTPAAEVGGVGSTGPPSQL